MTRTQARTTVVNGPRDQDRGPFRIGVAAGPWGPIHVAVTPSAVVGIAILTPREPFGRDVTRRTGRAEIRCGQAGRAGPLLDRSIAAIESFLAGSPAALMALPLELADRGAWDRTVLGAVRGLAWGEVASYGQVATAIGRRGAARAVGGSVGRNPIGLAIPCHRVIAGDGTIGGYGGDWFASRDELLAIKRELLAIEGVHLAPDRPTP